MTSKRDKRDARRYRKALLLWLKAEKRVVKDRKRWKRSMREWRKTIAPLHHDERDERMFDLSEDEVIIHEH